MAKKPSPEVEIIAAYSAAMTAAFQVLVLALQNNGALQRGDFQDRLAAYMEAVKDRSGNEIMLALLNDLRQGLMD
ncbi:hypothetical protein [Bradyrhizobium sp. USDA 4350]